jgi:hypothetical protein
MTSNTAKPAATVTIEPTRRRATAPCDHSIHVMLDLGARHLVSGDPIFVARVARQALEGFPSAIDSPDHRRVREVSTFAKRNKAGISTAVVVGVEGTAMSTARPDDDSVRSLRALLIEEGYRVTVREKRECTEADCRVDVMMEWDRPAEVPPRWHSNQVCGSHNYRTCARCKSVYMLTSTNAAGQAPSVHCEVCGLVIVEWGSSKVWTAQLVSRAA